MLASYFKITWRNILKNKGYSFINIFGLSMGIACCMLMFNYVTFELSYDDFHPAVEHTYRVDQVAPGRQEGGASSSTAPPLANAIKTTYPEVEDVMRINTPGDFLIRYEEGSNGTLAFNEKEIFLGECQILTMKPKDETLLPYAVELDVETTVDHDSTKLPVKRIVIKSGAIDFYSDRRQRTIYSIMNPTKKKFSLFIDHPFLDGWQLIESDEPVDITDRYYRFNTQVIGTEDKIVFNVRERTTDAESKVIQDLSKDDVAQFVQKGWITKEIEAKILHVLDQRVQSRQISLNILEKENEIRESKDTQERLRKNITVLSEKSPELNKYVKELGKEEDQLNILYAAVKKDKLAKQQIEQQVLKDAQAIEYKWNREIIVPE